MPQITYIEESGSQVVVSDAAVGSNLMEIATDNAVEGIDGNCGGVCSCATCHVHVAPDWMERVGPPSETESDVLEFEPNTSERSRLCCQIEMTGELDGIVVSVAT